MWKLHQTEEPTSSYADILWTFCGLIPLLQCSPVNCMPSTYNTHNAVGKLYHLNIMSFGASAKTTTASAQWHRLHSRLTIICLSSSSGYQLMLPQLPPPWRPLYADLHCCSLSCSSKCTFSTSKGSKWYHTHAVEHAEILKEHAELGRQFKYRY